MVPIAFSAIALAVGGRLGKYAGWLAFAVLTYTTGLLGFILFQLRSWGGSLVASYPWGRYLGDFTLVADGLSTPFALVISMLAALIAIYSISYMEHERNLHAYFALYLLYSAGMMGTVLVTNLAAFFVFFELMLIPSWALIGVWGTGAREKIAFKYFMFTEAGALFLLAGIVTARFLAGTFDVFAIAAGMERVSVGTAVAIVSAILLGLFVKMAIFPLHTWLPDAHAEAPTPISALLSPAMVGIGGYAAIRIVYTAFPMVLGHGQFVMALVVLAVVTMIYGGYMALAQDDIKRLLAYSSISQMGYLLFGVVSLSALGLTGAVLIYVSHGLGKAILFMVAGIFIHTLHTRSIRELGGLAGRMPYSATATLLGFLTLMGAPPLIGFWGEFFTFGGSIYTGTGFGGVTAPNLTRIWVTGIAVVFSAMTAGYGLWTVRRVFFGGTPEPLKEAKEGPRLMTAPILVLAVVAVVLGIYPTVLTNVAAPFLSQLLSGLTPAMGS
ncbi:NADH-quinone oxidoreductase subunit M [Candidatus Hecatella orcuttiae]|jgi:NADH-quinone oxidoreductase subunit M|uniref:complex I subunit 4 family protein n=1 Tax=Candidatus Hecatella orcuttiae TaxID=1935119 RepID=UPI002868174A|nr:NADH-quinone oxidoreductase subunit M [Candidatus Hecatella orcuttiae]